MRHSLVVAVSLCLAMPAGAQSVPTDSVSAAAFARARALVSDGNGQAGRTLVDSLLAAAQPGTTQYAEALYWRASLAERGVDAERDYRQLAVEYATAPRAADALVRLAQLDLVRGQPAAARDHLARLLRDHTDPPTRARAHYWLARTALDAGDPRGACAALSDAAAASPPGGDLARQVVALRGRVPRCTLSVAVGAAVPAGPPVRAAAAPTVPAPVAPAPLSGRVYSVQLAAYDSRPGADAMAARLVKRGIEARVVAGGVTPDAGPFRVRVGRWASRAEAAQAQRELKTKGLGGFVAEEPPGA